MTDFEKLQQMDIKDVHKKTCITIARLQDIMNKNFDNMDSATRTYGFIKILERELQLDLKDWVQEYNHYKQYGNIQSHEMVYTEENKQDTVNQDVLGQQDSHISLTTDPLPVFIISSAIIVGLVMATIFTKSKNMVLSICIPILRKKRDISVQ